ncbi:probable helicase with zinc finger domain isoform X1 [Saccostrea cucullata]|uniref:probable helicase with zinc finger domain isoform X1 n=1 Tax=Saccostrea cuccullata TaxID=36930 RepID=UPI002ED46EC4
MDKDIPSDTQRHDQPASIDHVLTLINSLVKEKNFQDALEHTNTALAKYRNNEKLQEKKIKILCHQGKFEEAFDLAKIWKEVEPQSAVAAKEFKKLKKVIQVLRDQDSEEEEDEEGDDSPPPKAPTPPTNPTQTEPTPTLPAPPAPPTQKSENEGACALNDEKDDEDFSCTFCDIKFVSASELETHCRSDLHKKRITSDEDQNWKYRVPPRNLTSEEFTICRSVLDADSNRYEETRKCTFGDKCTQAHSKEELQEWKERFKFRTQQIKRARDKHLHGNTYAEQLMEKLVNAENSKSVMIQNVEYAKVHVNSELKVNMTTKKCTNAWTFTITSKRSLHRVTLLDDTNRTYFYIASISVGPKKTQKYQNLETHCQEWVNPDYTTRHTGEYVYRVKVVFKTDIYGTFRQTLVYDFGLEPVLSREMQIESAPITDIEKLSKDLVLSEQGRWKVESVDLVRFENKPVPETEEEKQLLSKYSLPEADKFRLSEHLMHPPSKETYRIWMHEMLYIEEWAQMDHISRYNIKTSLQLVNRFLLVPGALSGAKYAQGGELFARMKLDDELSEDSAGGRLILMSSNVAWLAPYNPDDKMVSKQNKKVYQVLLEDKGKNFIFLRLPEKCVSELNLTCDQEFHAEIQFQLNRVPMCEMHSAIDQLPTLDLVFPPLQRIPTSPWYPEDMEFSETVSERLNEKQKAAIRGITAAGDKCLPPLLLVGPWGTGKTYTLAQAAKHALEVENNRILICTHSNSAADLYIKDFIHPIVKEGHMDAVPLRIYYRHRWVQTVPDVVLQYCLLEMSASQGNFRMPSREEVDRHRIIITTLKTARYLCDLDLPQGYFSHIFVDEAAQALESETLIPLSLAGRTTKIILAGDHMQLNPEVYSDFAKQQGFQKSMLDRLYELYPDDCPCKIMLCENYRSHEAIIDFTSDLFYDGKLISSGNQPAHPNYYPLTFFSTRGEDLQHENCTGFYNIAEVHEVVDRVDDLQKNWPPEWGEIEGNIGVVAPYSDQVFRIRCELRKRKMMNVSVERVFNVQGKQFRAIILSTVRTRHTCSSDSSQEDVYDYGFLSNVKLLNTALTRAQSIVVVVGDPLSLCLVGKCRKVWEYFLETCNEQKSFFGMKFSVLKAQLNSAELRKTYVLNPLAPEFVPNRLYHVTSQNHMTTGAGGHNPANPGYFVGQRMMYPGAPYHQQMYVPVPYQGYYPPVMYRPYVSPFVGGGMGGRGRVPARVIYPRQVPVSGSSPKSSSPAKSSGSDGERVASPDITRNTESPQGHGSSKKGHSSRSRPMVYVPRIPAPYPAMYYPYQPYPGYYYLPEDPRLAQAHTRYPYVAQGIPPQVYPHPYPAGPYIGPAIRAASQVSPENTPSPGERSPNSQRSHSLSPGPQRPPRSQSPALSPNSVAAAVAGGHFQLLPNVKHIPAHLYPKPGSTSSNSRSSTPLGGRDSPATEKASEEVRASLEHDYLKSVSPKLDLQERRASAQSPLARVISQRQGYIREELEAMTSHSSQRMITNSHYQSMMANNRSSSATLQNGAGGIEKNEKKPSKLDLHSATGFSRQFSEDITTPTEITNLVKMIDDMDDQESNNLSHQSFAAHKNTSGRLYLNIPQQQEVVMGGSASSSPPSGSPPSGDQKPTYAGVLRRRLPSAQGDIDPSLLEPQTPHTPLGFTTPGTEIDTDPLGILRNLNINASAESQRTYKYFS